MQSFFDALAPGWDRDFDPHLPARSAAAFLCGAGEGKRILDIACGTGAMFGELLACKPERLVGVDLSPAMLAEARKKYGEHPALELFCGDVTDYTGGPFDAALLYNAYPHFLDRNALLARVAALLAPGGRFTVAHSMGRERLNRHHANVPADIARDLLSAAEEASVWTPWFRVDGILDMADFYLITGTKI